MKIIIEYDTDNAAFDGEWEDRTLEHTRILDRVTDQIMTGEKSGKIRDYNGNTIGLWSVEGEI